jgi:hypothetical protein
VHLAHAIFIHVEYVWQHIKYVGIEQIHEFLEVYRHFNVQEFQEIEDLEQLDDEQTE